MTKHTKLPPKEEAGLTTELPWIFPQPNGSGGVGLCGSAQAKRIKTRKRDKHNLTVISGR